jgi:hypothetical protein
MERSNKSRNFKINAPPASFAASQHDKPCKASCLQPGDQFFESWKNAD